MSDSQDRENKKSQLLAVVQRHQTIRFGLACLAFVLVAAIIASAVAKLAEQPPWLTLAMAVFGPTGTVVILFGLYVRWVSGKIEKVSEREDQQQ